MDEFLRTDNADNLGSTCHGTDHRGSSSVRPSPVTSHHGSAAPDGEASELAELRRDLDAIDALLLEQVRARLETCLRIGEWKRQRAVPMMQPGRVQIVEERARDFANRHGLSPEFFVALYELMIGESCRLEDLVINEHHGGEDTVR